MMNLMILKICLWYFIKKLIWKLYFENLEKNKKFISYQELN